MKLMSYSQAQKLAKLATFYNAVTVSQEENYLNEVAYLKALQTQRQQAAQLTVLAAAQRAAAQRAAAQRAVPATPAPAAPAAPAPAGSGSDATQHQYPGLGLHPPA